MPYFGAGERAQQPGFRLSTSSVAYGKNFDYDDELSCYYFRLLSLLNVPLRCSVVENNRAINSENFSLYLVC